MTRLSELVDLDLLRYNVNRRYISVKAHPEDEDLLIYNYTNEAAYDSEWNDATKLCRGLIVRQGVGWDGEVIARPFRKFFNYGEHLMGHEEIPLHESFRVTTKEDGSLGILYKLSERWRVATRGSFASDQALWATEHFQSLYGDWEPTPGTTPLFEIIYPANRIVLDYGDRADLVHLATIDNETGLEVFEESWPGSRVETHDFADMESLLGYLKEVPAANREGFVVTFESGLKVKFKFEEYVRLHRILTGLSEMRIWEHISEGGSIEEFIDGVPDEFYQWVHDVDSRMRMQHELIMKGLEAKADYYKTREFTSRKDLALAMLHEEDRGWLFRAIDGQWDRLSDAVWKSLRPHGSITFRQDAEA